MLGFVVLNLSFSSEDTVKWYVNMAQDWENKGEKAQQVKLIRQLVKDKKRIFPFVW